MTNKVFPFILTTHTSIWSQPNDGGVNKRFHCTIEQSCSEIRRGYDTALIAYFNQNFRKGWHNFLEAEWLDLQTTGMNNATNAFKRTGLYPYNPNCESWAGAIATLGLATEDEKGKVQYEVYPTLPTRELSSEEQTILHDGLNMLQKKDITGEDVAAAMICGEHMLKRWHEDIEKAVREQEKCKEYANIILPQAKTDGKKIALTLVHFERIDYNNLPKVSVAQTKERRGEEITRKIVTTLQISEAIEIAAYLTSDPEENENSSCTDSSTTSDSVWGTALKNGPTTWTVFLKNKTQLTVSNKDLMNPSRFFVKGKC